MNERLSRTLAPSRFQTTLLSFLGALALVLASSGIYSVLSFVVASRIPEIGVRVTFGARQVDIYRLVLREGLTLAAFGMAAGLLLAAGSGRMMETFLFGVTPADPITFGLVPVGILVVVSSACLIPARRAARVDPARALSR